MAWFGGDGRVFLTSTSIEVVRGWKALIEVVRGWCPNDFGYFGWRCPGSLLDLQVRSWWIRSFGMWPTRRTPRWNPWCKRSASSLWVASQTRFQRHWLKRPRIGRRIIWTMGTCPWCMLWTSSFALQAALSTSWSPETRPRARSGSPVIVVKRLATPRCNDRTSIHLGGSINGDPE